AALARARAAEDEFACQGRECPVEFLHVALSRTGVRSYGACERRQPLWDPCPQGDRSRIASTTTADRAQGCAPTVPAMTTPPMLRCRARFRAVRYHPPPLPRKGRRVIGARGRFSPRVKRE